jgi:hypothetical protein
MPFFFCIQCIANRESISSEASRLIRVSAICEEEFRYRNYGRNKENFPKINVEIKNYLSFHPSKREICRFAATMNSDKFSRVRVSLGLAKQSKCKERTSIRQRKDSSHAYVDPDGW